MKNFLHIACVFAFEKLKQKKQKYAGKENKIGKTRFRNRDYAGKTRHRVFHFCFILSTSLKILVCLQTECRNQCAPVRFFVIKERDLVVKQKRASRNGKQLFFV
jgi:hypothetical protein